MHGQQNIKTVSFIFTPLTTLNLKPHELFLSNVSSLPFWFMMQKFRGILNMWTVDCSHLSMCTLDLTAHKQSQTLFHRRQSLFQNYDHRCINPEWQVVVAIKFYKKVPKISEFLTVELASCRPSGA